MSVTNNTTYWWPKEPNKDSFTVITSTSAAGAYGTTEGDTFWVSYARIIRLDRFDQVPDTFCLLFDRIGLYDGDQLPNKV